jgi:HK97 family phage portal protein
MRVAAVWGCVRLISAAIATCPVRVYRGDRYGKRETPKQRHPLAAVLRDAPNPHLTAACFWRAGLQHKLLAGNFLAHIRRDSAQRPVGLMLLNPANVATYQAHEVGRADREPEELFYRVNWDDGSWSWVDAADMIHVPNLGWNGKRGMSTVAYGAQAMGLALAAEESSARLFSNGMQANVVIQYPKAVSDPTAKQLREQYAKKQAGVSRAGTPFILTEGGEVKQISLSAVDAQLLESRQFSVTDICRFFGVPPVMIGESDKTTSWGSGVEQMGRWFVTYVLNDHFSAIEQELDRKLFGSSGYFAEIDEAELLRGDTTARANYYKAALGSLQTPAWMTPNEARAAEGFGPVEGGDELLRPVEKLAEPAPGTEEPK